MGQRRCESCRVLNRDTDYYCAACGRPLPWEVENTYAPVSHYGRSPSYDENVPFADVPDDGGYEVGEESIEQWEERVRREAGYPPAVEDVAVEVKDRISVFTKVRTTVSTWWRSLRSSIRAIPTLITDIPALVKGIPTLVKIIIISGVLIVGTAAITVISTLGAGDGPVATKSTSSDTESPTATPTPLQVFMIPKPGWIIQKDSSFDQEFQSRSGSLTLEVIHLATSEQTPKLYAESDHALMRDMGFVVSEIEDAKAAGYTGWQYTTTSGVSESWTVYLANGQSVYKMRCILTEKTSDDDYQDCRTMMNSLTVRG